MGNKLLKFPSEIDLVTAAQHEYDFLRIIDNKPALYSTPVLQNALFRYETYWLPLLAQNNNCIYSDFLSAPIDIEWIWHCHLLNPLAYRSDCNTIVGKVIDHRPMLSIMKYYSKESMELWNSKYPNIPYDVDTTMNNPPLINSEYKQKGSYDIVSAAQLQRVFIYNSSLPHFRDVKFLK